MTKLKQALVSEEATIIWRMVIMVLIGLLGWTFNRQIDRIDFHEKKIYEINQFIISEFVKKEELCELKNDVKAIQLTLNKTLPEISQFMGQTMEYMRANGDRK